MGGCAHHKLRTALGLPGCRRAGWIGALLASKLLRQLRCGCAAHLKVKGASRAPACTNAM